MDEVLQWLAGPTMGAALAGLVVAVATFVRRRGEASASALEAEAAQDKAGADAVLELLSQMRSMRRDLERVTARVAELERDLGDATAQRLHWENEARIARAERDHAIAARVAADARAEASTAELKRALLQIHGGFTHTSDMPPKAEDV
jgi:seryl-tRNA synthetase